MEKPASSKEAASLQLVENSRPELGTEGLADIAAFDNVGLKKLVRKIDRTLLPLLTLLYLLSFLDRTNIANARLDTFEADLSLVDIRYNHALAIFFPFYVAAEIPSNMAMKRFPPWVWIPFIMIIWGTLCTVMGLVHNYEGLLACRAVLGLAEGGLFPGIAF
jgi:MFS family permease